MESAIGKGFSFGLTSGIITTLGIIVGLNSSTHSKLIIIAGILIVTIADALSDAVGVHILQENDVEQSVKQIWAATISTFVFKFVVAITFIVPIMLFELTTAIIASIIWGLLMLSIFSVYLAKKRKLSPIKVVAEHVIITIIVIIITHYLGSLVAI